VKYQHAHHAGNFADVVKHLVLVELLEALKRKETPFFYMESHAGRGIYPLPPPAERGESEYAHGFGLLAGKSFAPAALSRYVDLVERLGRSGGGSIRAYPGSPLIATTLLRRQDRAVFFESQVEEAAALRRVIGKGRISLHRSDGFDGFRSQLPPLERRGLVLVDPPYEETQQDFNRILAALREGMLRWRNGIYAIWYPIKRRAPVSAFHASLGELGLRRVLCAELSVFPEDSRVSLNGCGMIVVNAPWQLDHDLQQALPVLHDALGARPNSSVSCRWLVPE
jgi:23S rRNA (adenine2030-N6)-methyltransferase